LRGFTLFSVDNKLREWRITNVVQRGLWLGGVVGLLKIVVACGLVGLGWAAAKAQTSSPDFELVIDAPGGGTNVDCVRGCTLMWVERGVNPQATPTRVFTFACTASRCGSGRVGGWRQWESADPGTALRLRRVRWRRL